MKFVDYVTITVRSGQGGPGSRAFRREKYVPFGGPWGGDGGKGGSVILEGDPQLNTLLDLRYNRHHFAKPGGGGQKALKSGKDGEDIILRVPLGTQASDSQTAEVLGEVSKPGERLVLATGGRGGRGNNFFKSATNQAPDYAQPGEPGEEREITLELRLLADVGMVGFPNAGKSTLLSVLSAARPKVADYPFTTLQPILGMVRVRDYQSFVLADMPGIIEGAHEGRGLGHQFLKHIERNALLLFVLPLGTEQAVTEQYDVLLAELVQFSADLASKPRFVVLTKADTLPAEDAAAAQRALAKHVGSSVPSAVVSAVAQQGIESLRQALWEIVEGMLQNEDTEG